MNRSDIKSIITLSNPNFYIKIIQKYQTGKRNTSRFPRMIFYKERGHIVPQKISLILKFRLHLDKQTILSCLIMKYLTESKKILKPLFLAVNALFYHQTLHTVPSDIEAVNPHVLNYESNTKILGLQIFREKLKYRPLYIVRNSPFIGKGNKPENQSLPENKSPTIYLSKQNGVTFLIEKNTSVIKGMIPGLNIIRKTSGRALKLKNTLNLGYVAKSLTDVTSVLLKALKIPRMYQVESESFPSEHISICRILVPSLLKSSSSFLDINSAASQQKFDRVYSTNRMFIPKFLNCEKDAQNSSLQMFKGKTNHRSLSLARHSTFESEEEIFKNQSLFENQLPEILLKNNLLSSNTNSIFNKDLFKGSDRVAVNKLLIKKSYDNFVRNDTGSLQNIYPHKAGREKLLFYDQGRLEQEIGQIKKIVIETKKSVSEKTMPASGEGDIKRYIDINRISDQVYQNIERRIRMERERRGI